MGDKQSGASNEPTGKEFFLTVDPKTLDQLSSSGKAAQQHRKGQASESLEEETGGHQKQAQGGSRPKGGDIMSLLY
jgi:hypothetical protein